MKKRPKASWRMFRYTTEVHNVDWTKYTKMLHETGAIHNVLADKDDDK